MRDRLGRCFIAGAALGLLVSGAGCGDSSGGNPPGPTPTPSGNANRIVFSPAVVRLENPTSKEGKSAPSSFTIGVMAYDENGDLITPTAETPITIALHGAPDGVVTPETATITSGSSATFQYDGSYFPNPIGVTAWISATPGGQVAQVAGTDGSSSGSMALDRTQLLHLNPIDCTYGTASYALPLVCDDPQNPTTCAEQAIEKGLKVKAAIGYDAPSAGDFVEFAMDTGSLGVVVPAKELGPDAIGPGAAGQVFYDSSGNTYAGNYYLTPVSFELADGTVVSSEPIKVLGITTAFCAKGYPKCDEHPPTPTLRYLGVGFDRGTTNPDDQLGTPADNPFLHLTNAQNGTNVSPGYVLGGSTINVGIESTAGYGIVPLTPSTTVPGDWQTMSGCYGFPELADQPQFCGTLLLDVGITEMFIDLVSADRPPGSEEPSCGQGGGPCKVPDGTKMQIIAGSADAQAASYEFTVSSQPVGAAPEFVRWIDKPQVFVNTGRRPLFQFDYLYDSRCGNVGFMEK